MVECIYTITASVVVLFLALDPLRLVKELSAAEKSKAKKRLHWQETAVVSAVILLGMSVLVSLVGVGPLELQLTAGILVAVLLLRFLLNQRAQSREMPSVEALRELRPAVVLSVPVLAVLLLLLGRFGLLATGVSIILNGLIIQGLKRVPAKYLGFVSAMHRQALTQGFRWVVLAFAISSIVDAVRIL